MKVIVDSVDYRYKNTLRINFGNQVGLGSSFEDVGDMGEEEKELFELEGYSDQQIQDMLDTTERINYRIRNMLIKPLELDWRDSSELEIHNCPEGMTIDDIKEVLDIN